METKRLLLRNFTLNDIDACYQCWGQDQTLGRYILNYPMTDRQQMAELVQGFLANQDAWVLIDKKRDAVEPAGGTAGGAGRARAGMPH